MHPEASKKSSIYVLILCGGGGTRLWPRSREKTPKQFINLLGEKTIFAQTMARARALTTEDKIFIVTNADYVDEVYAQGKVPLRNVIAEPQKKNTAMAMAVGAAVIEKIDPEAVIVNMPSDTLISPVEKFVRSMKLAVEAARKTGNLITVGVKPNFPHTGLGYMQKGAELTRVDGEKIFRVMAFKEKPDLETATTFLKTGDYFWNANLYTWKASVFLEACEKYIPKTIKAVRKVQEAWGTEEERGVMEKAYAEVDDVQVDYAVSEKADNLALLTADFNWGDVGNWKVVWETLPKDESGNVMIRIGGAGEVFSVESRNNLVQFGGRLIALVGVDDIVVVDTEDALLVCKKDKAQDVKKIVEMLKDKSRKEYL